MADRNRLINMFTDISRIDAESYGEARVAAYLKERLTELGFEVSQDDTGNLYGILKGEGAAEPLLFSAHMDTVKPGIGKVPVVLEDRIVSEGDMVLGADDICGITEILEGIRLAKERGDNRGDIEVLFTAAEEVYAKGSKAFDFSRVSAKDAYVLDMSGAPGTAARKAPSILSFEIEVRGKASHAGFKPEAGVNALKAAAAAIAKLEIGKPTDTATLNIGTIEAGRADNIVPELCRCTGEVRSFDHEEALALVEKVRDTFAEEAGALGASLGFNKTVNLKAYETPLDAKVCRDFTNACGKLGLAGDLVATHGGSDNNVFAEHGITGIVIANGMYKTHSTEEYALIDEMVSGAELVAALIKER